MMLYQLGFTLQDIQSALASNNINVPVGSLAEGDVNTSIRINNRFETLEDLKQTLVTGRAGQVIYLSEIADVHSDITDQSLVNRTYFKNDEESTAKDSIYGTIYRKKGEDVIGTSAFIKQLMTQQRGQLYPSDVSVEIVYDNADNVERDLSNIQLSAGSGLLVVIMVLFLFIGLKESLIVSITMPLSLLLTLGLLSYLGISLNTFAILGLIVALGLLVDNSIIVMENMDRLYRLGYAPFDAALQGTSQVALPILASTLTTIAAFFPLAILPGIMGAFINTIPRTIILALLSSLVISITVTPSIYLLMLNRTAKTKKVKRQSKFMRIVGIGFIMVMSFTAFYDPESALILPVAAVLFFTTLMVIKTFFAKGDTLESSVLIRMYESVLSWILEKNWRQIFIIFMGFFILVASSLLIPLGILKVSFFPQNEPSSLTVLVDTPGGMTLENTAEIVSEVEGILIEEPVVKIFNTAIGGQNEDIASIAVTFYDKSELSYNGFEALQRIESAFKDISDARIEIKVASQGGPPSGKPIAIEFLADDYEAGKHIADEFLKQLNEIPGVYNAAVSVTDSGPNTEIEINPILARQYGLTLKDVASQVSLTVNGVVATNLKVDQDLVDVRLIYTPAHNKTLTDLEGIMIQTSTGQWIPLSSVATFKTTQGLSSIQHADGNRIITLEADVLEGYNASDVNQTLAEKTSDIVLPAGVSQNVSGEIQQIQDSFKDLLRSMVLAILLVFVILTVQFKSLIQPFAILTTVPMAFIGVFVGLTITGNEFGFYAFMGLVSLVGIAVNDAIVLIDFMNGQRKEGYGLKEAIIESGKTRFNPVLATTLTTIGGVLPLAFREVYYAQFSFTLVFGLLVTTLMTLVLIPTTYHLLERIKMKITKEVASDEA
jgi:HAE1 family hydrophobic/amphiphilic exporter-1